MSGKIACFAIYKTQTNCFPFKIKFENQAFAINCNIKCGSQNNKHLHYKLVLNIEMLYVFSDNFTNSNYGFL